MPSHEQNPGYKTYLGDSVYVEVEDGYIKLTTNNGYPDDPRNVIMMEPGVYAAFEQWLHHLREVSGVRPDPAGSQDPHPLSEGELDDLRRDEVRTDARSRPRRSRDGPSVGHRRDLRPLLLLRAAAVVTTELNGMRDATRASGVQHDPSRPGRCESCHPDFLTPPAAPAIGTTNVCVSRPGKGSGQTRCESGGRHSSCILEGHEPRKARIDHLRLLQGGH